MLLLDHWRPFISSWSKFTYGKDICIWPLQKHSTRAGLAWQTGACVRSSARATLLAERSKSIMWYCKCSEIKNSFHCADLKCDLDGGNAAVFTPWGPCGAQMQSVLQEHIWKHPFECSLLLWQSSRLWAGWLFHPAWGIRWQGGRTLQLDFCLCAFITTIWCILCSCCMLRLFAMLSLTICRWANTHFYTCIGRRVI